MKTLFKVWNVLIIIAAILSLIGCIVLITGGGILLAAGAGAIAGAVGTGIVFLLAIPSIISAIISLIAGVSGFKGQYHRCFVLGIVILILNALSLIFTMGSGISVTLTVLSLIISILYVVLAKSLENKKLAGLEE